MELSADVVSLVETAKKIDENPLSLGARFLGLGAEEQRRGVPLWAWIVLALGVGAAGAAYAAPRLAKKLSAGRRAR